jgi:hypothetical protein
MMARFSVRSHTILVLAVVVALAAGVVAHRAEPRPARDSGDVPYTTWIDSRGAGLFDPATPQLRGLDASYRVDARIMLPLGFTTVQLWSRPDVGTADASYRDRQTGTGDIVRGYELFSASRPDRARGLDRMGFFREVVRLTPQGPAWTAYFGAMTSSPEQTYREAVKANDSSSDRIYDATDGMASGLETSAAVFKIATTHRADSANDLYAEVRPQLGALTPRRSELVGSPAKPLPPSAFLGALEASLQTATVVRDGSHSRPLSRVPFIHNGRVRQLELLSVSPDLVRGRQFASAHFARAAETVYLLQYRIVNPGSDDASFRLWAELPPVVRGDPQAPPIVPLAWETQVRSFLRLYYERVR